MKNLIIKLYKSFMLNREIKRYTKALHEWITYCFTHSSNDYLFNQGTDQINTIKEHIKLLKLRREELKQ